MSFEESFIIGCVKDFKNQSVSVSLKEGFCQCGHDYLFGKYDSIIYEPEFEINNSDDSLHIAECFKLVISNSSDDASKK